MLSVVEKLFLLEQYKYIHTSYYSTLNEKSDTSELLIVVCRASSFHFRLISVHWVYRELAVHWLSWDMQQGVWLYMIETEKSRIHLVNPHRYSFLYRELLALNSNN